MKIEQHNNNKRLLSSLLRTAKSVAYFIFLLLTYALGYLSAPSATSSQPPQQQAPPFASSTPLNAVFSSSDFDSTSNSVIRVTVNSTELDSFRVTTRCADPISPELVRRTLVDRLFNGTSPFSNFPPPHAAPLLRRTKKIKGWGSNGAVFENLIRRVKPRVIVEVGTFLGASAIHMAELTQRLGLSTQILCIDDFRGWAGFRDRFSKIPMVNGDVLLYYQFLMNAVNFNKTGSILPVPFSSGSALIKLCEWGVYADLVEIDAGHDFFSAWSDITRGYQILRPGGIIFGHDYFTAADNRGVRRAVDLFAKVNGLKIKIDGQHWVLHST
ncbi:uncharacterized protein LOC107472912 [Arachis duranensis]|uniref:Uncharacterized protein LOC107472912 n=1 Tax=Arachis duranensis TaxID=130453 RepID=A0A6P4BU03_ARADU|nr:uncharacterized protein LOC107472912 [Arachis duranensis]